MVERQDILGGGAPCKRVLVVELRVEASGIRGVKRTWVRKDRWEMNCSTARHGISPTLDLTAAAYEGGGQLCSLTGRAHIPAGIRPLRPGRGLDVAARTSLPRRAQTRYSPTADSAPPC